MNFSTGLVLKIARKYKYMYDQIHCHKIRYSSLLSHTNTDTNKSYNFHNNTKTITRYDMMTYITA